MIERDRSKYREKVMVIVVRYGNPAWKGKSEEANAKGKSAKADPKGKATHQDIQERASVIHGLLCKDANMSRDEVASILREIFAQ